MQLSIRPRHSTLNLEDPKVRKDFVMIRNILNMLWGTEVINPAVQGTLGMLKSALKNGYASIPKYMRIYIHRC